MTSLKEEHNLTFSVDLIFTASFHCKSIYFLAHVYVEGHSLLGIRGHQRTTCEG